MTMDELPSYRRPVTGKLYNDPCQCPFCRSMPLYDELNEAKAQNARLLALLKECREAIASLMAMVEKGGG